MSLMSRVRNDSIAISCAQLLTRWCCYSFLRLFCLHRPYLHVVSSHCPKCCRCLSHPTVLSITPLIFVHWRGPCLDIFRYIHTDTHLISTHTHKIHKNFNSSGAFSLAASRAQEFDGRGSLSSRCASFGGSPVFVACPPKTYKNVSDMIEFLRQSHGTVRGYAPSRLCVSWCCVESIEFLVLHFSIPLISLRWVTS